MPATPMQPSSRLHALAGLALAALACAAPAEAEVFNPQLITLDNGMRVVLIENQAMPAVAHYLYYGVGSADEPPGRSGIAHLFEHLMLKGTSTYPDAEFSQTIARVGGEENAFTTWDFTGYFQIVAPEHLHTMMRMEADRMTNLIMTPEAIDTERQVVYEEYATRIANEPSVWLGTEARSALFTRHPYGIPIIGYMDELAAVDYDDFIAFYETWYAPGNAVAAVSGPVTLAELQVMAKDTYGRIPARAVPERVWLQEPRHYGPRLVELAEPLLGQASWIRQYVAPSYFTGASEHAYALQVLATILGSGTGSRFYQRLVLDRGVAIDGGVFYDASAMGPGMMVLYAVPPSTGDDEAAVAAIQAAFAAELDVLLAEGVTAEEVEVAVRRLRADAIFVRDSLDAAAKLVGQALITGQTIEQIESWPDRIGAVTVEQVNAAAAAVFDTHDYVTGIALPRPAN